MLFLHLIVTMSALAPNPAAAATLFQTGFEPPDYSTGSLPGQNGWGQDTGPAGLINVQTGIVSSGLQAVRFQSIPGLPIYTRATRGGIGYDTAGADPIVFLQMDIRLSSIGDPSLWRPFATFDQSHFIGGFDVLPTREVRVAAGSGSGQFTGIFLAPDTWYRIGLALNFSTFTLDALLNGTPLATGLPFAGAAGSTIFGGFTVENVASGTDSLFFDNVSVSTVPEPASFLPVLLVLSFFAVRYRRAPRH